MIVTVDIVYVIGVCVLAAWLCGGIGYFTGLKIGGMRALYTPPKKGKAP